MNLSNIKKYVTPFSIGMTFIFILGVILRYWDIDVRPLHHDESLHGMYGKYYYEDPANGFYKYNPMLHGPFMYHLLPWFYYFLGVTKFALRFPSLLLGSLMILSPLLFKKKMQRSMLLIISLFIATSPTLVYWSRFIRHDYFALFSIFLIIFGMVSNIRWAKSLILIGITLGFCIKENAYLHLALFLGFSIYYIIYNKKNFLKIEFQVRLPLIIGAIFSIFIYCYYYSGGFNYSQGILDGLYRKSLSYWFGQHTEERLKGPFFYQLFILGTYEKLFLIGIFTHLFFQLKDNLKSLLLPLVLSTLASSIFLYIDIKTISFLFNTFKLKNAFDFFLFSFLIYYSLWGTTKYLKERDFWGSFSFYFFISSFFAYSFVGEKVPWLSIYPLFFGLIHIFLIYNRKEFKPITLIVTSVLILIINLSETYRFSFKQSGAINQVISQVHTTPTFEKMALQLKAEIESKEIGKGNTVRIIDGLTWPITWFLYGNPEFRYHGETRNIEKENYIFSLAHNKAAIDKLRDTHSSEKIPLRWWYQPNWKNINLEKTFKYVLFQEPWNSTGTMNILFFKKNSLKITQ